MSANGSSSLDRTQPAGYESRNDLPDLCHICGAKAGEACKNTDQTQCIDPLIRDMALGKCTTCKRMWCVCRWRTGDA